MHCVFCEEDGGAVLWRDEFCRVVRAQGGDYPGLCRVVLNQHVKEMTDLPDHERTRLMQVVLTTESVLRGLFQPDKMNLASFGNQVPHLHWHVIARSVDDPHYPDPAWGPVRRPAPAARPEVSDAALAAKLAELLG